MCISILGNSDFSTSRLILLSMNGRRILWSYLITSLFLFSLSWSVRPSLALLPRSNHSSKSSEEEKISGSKKFNRLHSSWRLFCRGVPVKSNLFFDFNYLILLDVWESSFLILCASSIIMYYHWNFESALMQIRMASKVVIQTSNLPGCNSFLMISSRCSFLAMRLQTLISGHHFLNSDSQLPTTDFGIIIKCTPLIALNSLKKAINPIV